jgi:hypothetical protein
MTINSLTPKTDQLVEDFLAKVEFEPLPIRKRIIFAIDATASRQPTWDLACQVQAQMFIETGRYGGIDVQLVYYRGFGEMKATKFFGSAAPLIQAMTGVICRAGHTQLTRVFQHIQREHEQSPIAAAILIGDCCEEPPSVIEFSARQLSIPVYAFLEGADPDGKAAFATIAKVTNGALIPFNANSPTQLRELLGAVALLVVGGVEALADLRPEVVALLACRDKT